MTEWIRLPGGQALGFWPPGLLFFGAQELPYLVMPLMKLSANPIMELEDRWPALAAAEKALGILCVLLLVFVVKQDGRTFSLGSRRELALFGLAVAALALNWAGWGLYFAGRQSRAVLLGLLTVLPPAYYGLLGGWRGNWPLVIAAGLFLPVHFLNVWSGLG